jgi:hypothetical protein
VVTVLAVAANAFSGVAALVHFHLTVPGMVKVGVPRSWLTFPIGTLNTAGALGLLVGLEVVGIACFVPYVAAKTAIGLGGTIAGLFVQDMGPTRDRPAGCSSAASTSPRFSLCSASCFSSD